MNLNVNDICIFFDHNPSVKYAVCFSVNSCAGFKVIGAPYRLHRCMLRKLFVECTPELL